MEAAQKYNSKWQDLSLTMKLSPGHRENTLRVKIMQHFAEYPMKNTVHDK